ncbi:hypothetical protein GCM10009583_16690 [Ornithinicoccus hortensis]
MEGQRSCPPPWTFVEASHAQRRPPTPTIAINGTTQAFRPAIRPDLQATLDAIHGSELTRGNVSTGTQIHETLAGLGMQFEPRAADDLVEPADLIELAQGHPGTPHVGSSPPPPHLNPFHGRCPHPGDGAASRATRADL